MYVIPLITAAGTVLAAIVTGFLAAKLKHKWDVEDADTKWDRERNERRRDELREALLGFLDVRDAMEREAVGAFTSITTGQPATRSDPGPAIINLIRQANRLQILVNQATSAKIGEDVNKFIAWYRQPPVQTASTGGVALTTTAGMRDFARQILKDMPLA